MKKQKTESKTDLLEPELPLILFVPLEQSHMETSLWQRALLVEERHHLGSSFDDKMKRYFYGMSVGCTVSLLSSDASIFNITVNTPVDS